MVEFRSANGELHRSVRGKTAGAHGEFFTFQWTTAVKSLALLALRAAVLGIQRASISGEEKSVASALDYALSKPPEWLEEMFGSDSRGEGRAKRLFRRSNPERKRPGPVTISFNPNQFQEGGIEISIGQRKLSNPLELKNLYHSLLQFSGIDPASVGPELTDEEVNNHDAEGELFDDIEQQFLFEIYQREIRDSLSSARISSAQWMRERLQLLNSDPLFRKINSPHPDTLTALLNFGPSAERLGIYDQFAVTQAFSANGPVRIFTSAAGTGFLALCHYLRDFCGLPIDLRCFYPYGVDVVQSVRVFHDDSTPTICCTGLGPTAEFFHNPHAGFSPFLLGPCLTHRLVQAAPPSKGQIPAEELLFVTDNPTSALFCFDGLVKAGLLKPSKFHLRHCEPEDTLLSLLQNPSSKSLMWFPHYHLLERHMGASIIGDTKSASFAQITVMFGNRALHRNDAMLQTTKLLFRDAWLTLLEQPLVLARVARSMLADEQFVRFVKRCSGLHYLPLDRAA